MMGQAGHRERGRATGAFTLVELILVLGLLATLAAFAAPTLSRSFRGRTVEGEAERLLALNEYARNEAASSGVPVVVWADPDTRRYGAGAKAGYPADNLRSVEYTLHPDVSFDALNNVQPGQKGQGYNVAEYAPDGTLDPASTDTVRLVDRFENSLAIAQTDDHYGYEIVREAAVRR